MVEALGGVPVAEDAGRRHTHATLVDLVRAKGVNTTYVSRVLRQAAELQLDDLLAGFPLEWEGQRIACRSTGLQVAD
jgi:hypothetical protein